LNKLTTTWLIATIGLLCLFSGPLLADEFEGLKATSDSTLEFLQKAIEEKDSDPVLSILTSDAAIITTHGKVVQGYLTMKTSLTAIFFLAGNYKVEIKRHSLNLIDSVGYETGMYTLRQLMEDGTERQLTGRFTLIWQKEDGTWKIHRAIGLR